MIRTIYRARFVLAEADLLLHDAAVHVSELGRISRVEPWTGATSNEEVKVVDWGPALIMPGLVNAHSHLELTRLCGRLGPCETFTEWLQQVIDARRLLSPADLTAAAAEGARAALESGTTLIGDISAMGVSWRALKDCPLRKVVFEEVLGLATEQAPGLLAALTGRLDTMETDDLLSPGISPHAPYSVSPALFRGASELARSRELPLATHVAETESEVEFLVRGAGEFRDFLSRLGVLPPHWTAPGLPPLEYMDSLGLLDRPVVLIHGNCLDAESLETILGSRSSVVYCPRSHDYFRHPEHPTRKLLDMGINVGLGTDSLASNETLSMLDEMRYLYATRKDLKPEQILRMATLNGASALGFGGVLGRLRRGYWADMTVLRLPGSAQERNLLQQIMDGSGEPAAAIVKGEVAWVDPVVGSHPAEALT